MKQLYYSCVIVSTGRMYAVRPTRLRKKENRLYVQTYSRPGISLSEKVYNTIYLTSYLSCPALKDQFVSELG